MSLLSSLFIGFITLYLQFTTLLAGQVSLLLPATDSSLAQYENEQSEQTTLTDLESRYNTIPDILIKNSSYQGAAAINGLTSPPNSPVTDPRDALVNIYCQHRNEDTIRAVTGTGYFISPDGVILTNAHVAQFLLLEGIIGESSCTIRTGSPAVANYTADLLYISPAWVIEHASMIDAKTPKGTGERDYALLYITAGLANQPLPARFPALALDTQLISTSAVASTVTVAGYPAEAAFAGGNIDAALTPKTATTTITELMTFGSNYADVFSVGGTALGEQGSSGGPILSDNDEVIGLISTRGDDGQFGTGSLRAITLSYIDRTMIEETSLGLLDTLDGDLPLRSDIFKDTVIPILQSLLRQEL